MKAAIDDLRSQEVPQYRPTARKHGVNHQTLRRQFLGLQLSSAELHECQSLLNNKEAIALINEINRLSACGTPPTVAMVRSFAFNISGRWPGINWANRFVHNHQEDICSVYLKGFDLSRKKADS
jgi:hypothetical protein